MLLSLPPEAIEKVVTFVTAQEVVGGPPPGLYALMQTCRYLHYLLSPEHNPGMFYRLFRDLFDLAAPQRRTSCSSTGPAQFAAETCQRFASLRLIRAGSFDHPEMCKSLLVTYVMVLEDDGKNGMHLQWAGLRNFLQVYLTEHYPDNDTNDSLWSIAIILQTQWLFIDTLRSESEDERDGMLSMLDPHLLGQLYFKPTTCCESNDIASSNSCSGFPSRCLHALPHYGHCYDVDIPAIAPYAILSYILRVERYHLVNPQNVPATRSARIGFGPTKEDFDHYNAACLAHASPDHFSPQATSSQNDSDWARLISRHATLLPGTRVRSFRVGDLSGFWDGTLLLPSLHPVNKNAGHQRGLGPVEYLSRRPIALELREHYSNATPLSPVVCCEQAFDKSSIQSVLCECALNLRGRCHEVDACLHSDKVHCVSPACTCNCFSKRVELNDSAVTEVFLSGTTPAEHGVAWGSYRFRGRVRMSDGLVILRRDPIGFGAASPAWLFGYVLGSRQLVGRWHVGSLQNEAPWEGVFGLWKSVT